MYEAPRPSIDDITRKPTVQKRGIGKSLKLGIGVAVLAACTAATGMVDHQNRTREDLVAHWSEIARDALLSQQEQRNASQIMYPKVVVTHPTIVRNYPTIDWVSTQIGTLSAGTEITGSGVLLTSGITPVTQGAIQQRAYAVFECGSTNNPITRDGRDISIDPRKICVIDANSIQVPKKNALQTTTYTPF